PLGSLAILMIYHLTGGGWGFLIRRTLAAATRTLPLLAVLFVPPGLGLADLYPWMSSSAMADDSRQQFYFDPPFVYVRGIIYFVIWCGLAWLLNAWTRQLERTGDRRWRRRLRHLSGVGLVLYGITMHFAVADWVLTLQPKFHSTILPPLVVAR